MSATWQCRDNRERSQKFQSVSELHRREEPSEVKSEYREDEEKAEPAALATCVDERETVESKEREPFIR
jgi:hypothetical protein